MTRKQIEREVRRAVLKYREMLYLNHWVIYYGFADDPESDFARARVLQRPWEYRQASIEFYPQNMRNDTKEEIHEHVLHELLHLVVAEMQEKNLKHEERVVSWLTTIISDMETAVVEMKEKAA